MAGFLFLLSEESTASGAFEAGVYSTKVKPPAGHWLSFHEATLADFLSMREGDFVFFFQKRKIYGVGRLVSVAGSCVYLNFPSASDPTIERPHSANDVLFSWTDLEEAGHHRWLCTFEGAPGLLPNPVDMDDALSSRPQAFRSLRVIEKRSFVKMDDEENRALLDILARRNSTAMKVIPAQSATPHGHRRVLKHVTPAHRISAGPVVSVVREADGSVKHEMALEAALVEALTREETRAAKVFGKWSYISHQVAASPFKPVLYMDRIDVFGYRRSPPFDSITDYLVVEVKRDAAMLEDVAQLMKYVDWIAQQHTGGDYSMIHAFLVAFDFEISSRKAFDLTVGRGFTVGTRPTRSETWNDLKLVKYTTVKSASPLAFEIHAL